jgi:hypothetical protein
VPHSLFAACGVKLNANGSPSILAVYAAFFNLELLFFVFVLALSPLIYQNIAELTT